MSRRRLSILVVLIVALLQSTYAHPHQWVDAILYPVLENGQLEGVRVEWQLRYGYAVDIACRYDQDNDGVFNVEELASLYDTAFMPLVVDHFYLHIKVGGQSYAPTAVQDFSADMPAGDVRFYFYVPCHIPAEPGTPISISAFDPTYYTSFDLLDCRVQGRTGMKYSLVFEPDERLPSHGPFGCGAWAVLDFGPGDPSTTVVPGAGTLVPEDADSVYSGPVNPFTGKP